jgi:hypothetical protein
MINILLTEDDFDRQYPLRANHLDPDATWAFDDGPGCLFGLSREELQFVMAQDPKTVWTLIDGDDGLSWLVSGVHHVNRVGYLVSTVPAPDDATIEVQLETYSDSNADA